MEDRQDLLGHKRQEITTHYSAAEVGELLASANRVLEARAPSSTALLRIVASRNWWVVRGSNPRHSPCKGDALPAELTTH